MGRVGATEHVCWCPLPGGCWARPDGQPAECPTSDEGCALIFAPWQAWREGQGVTFQRRTGASRRADAGSPARVSPTIPLLPSSPRPPSPAPWVGCPCSAPNKTEGCGGGQGIHGDRGWVRRWSGCGLLGQHPGRCCLLSHKQVRLRGPARAEAVAQRCPPQSRVRAPRQCSAGHPDPGSNGQQSCLLTWDRTWSPPTSGGFWGSHGYPTPGHRPPNRKAAL